MVEHRGDGGGLPASRRSGHDHEAAVPVGDVQVALGQMVILEVLDLLKTADGNTAPDEGLDDVDAKAGLVDVVGEVHAVVMLETASLGFAHHGVGQEDDVLFAEAIGLGAADDLLDAVVRRAIGVEVQVGGPRVGGVAGGHLSQQTLHELDCVFRGDLEAFHKGRVAVRRRSREGCAAVLGGGAVAARRSDGSVWLARRLGLGDGGTCRSLGDGIDP